MFLQNYKEAVDSIYKQLEDLGIATTDLKIDHMGYQASSAQDYDDRISEIGDSATPFDEHIVGGRRVGVFKLATPLNYKGQEIPLFEIFEPREGQKVSSAWEHVEFLVSATLEDFMTKYSEIEWDTYALNRDEFPMLILNLKDGLRAKFPRKGVIEESERVN